MERVQDVYRQWRQRVARALEQRFPDKGLGYAR